MGRDTFIKYTRAYHDWCQEHAGQYLHHHPNDDPSLELTEGVDIVSTSDTAEALRLAGFLVDTELWPVEFASCTNCYSGKHEKPPKN